MKYPRLFGVLILLAFLALCVVADSLHLAGGGR